METIFFAIKNLGGKHFHVSILEEKIKCFEFSFIVGIVFGQINMKQ